MFIIVCPTVQVGMPSFEMGRSVVVPVIAGTNTWLPPELTDKRYDIYITIPLPVFKETRHLYIESWCSKYLNIFALSLILIN